MKHVVAIRFQGLLVVLALSGCADLLVATYTARFEESELPIPLIEPMPARVGVYYPPKLIDHEDVRPMIKSEPESHPIAFGLGPPSIQIFDQAFTYSFDEVRRVDMRPPFSVDTADLDAVIEVSLGQLDTDYAPIEYYVTVTYIVTLWGLDGSQLVTWRSTQSSHTDPGIMASALRGSAGHGDFFGKTAADAIGEVAADFMRSFSGQLEVQEWIENLVRQKENISCD